MNWPEAIRVTGDFVWIASVVAGVVVLARRLRRAEARVEILEARTSLLVRKVYEGKDCPKEEEPRYYAS